LVIRVAICKERMEW